MRKILFLALIVTITNIQMIMAQEKITQTAGRTQLGEFAPKFAELNDDVLFGEVWNRPGLSPHDRSMITIATLIGKGIIDSSLTHHLQFEWQSCFPAGDDFSDRRAEHGIRQVLHREQLSGPCIYRTGSFLERNLRTPMPE